MFKKLVTVACIAGVLTVVAAASARGGPGCGDHDKGWWSGCAEGYMRCLGAGGGDSCIIKNNACEERCSR